MSCYTTTTTSGPCVSCIHPFDYLFELAYQGTIGPNNRSTFAENVSRFLDKGVINTNCNICCPDCNGIYSLSNVEIFAFLADGLGISAAAAVPASPLEANTVSNGNNKPCCSNVYASVETWLNYAENMGLTESAAVPASPYKLPSGVETEVPYNEEIATCCNGFTECVDDLICWITQNNTSNGGDIIDRLLDKGVVEYSGIYNNCTNSSVSSICHLIDLLETKYPDVNLGGTRSQFIDRLLDKGVTISCSSNGEIIIGSTETWLTYANAVGILPSPAVPAIGQTTTTTTIV
jgi:hypothetical protein